MTEFFISGPTNMSSTVKYPDTVAPGAVATPMMVLDDNLILRKVDGSAGGLPRYNAAGTLETLAAGTNDQVLTMSGGLPTWAASAGSLRLTAHVSRATSLFNILDATETTMAFNSAAGAGDYNGDSLVDLVTNVGRITIPADKAGRWRFSGLIRIEGGAGSQANKGEVIIRIRKNRVALTGTNGTLSYESQQQPSTNQASSTSYVFTTILDCAVADTYDITVEQTSGTDQDISFGPTQTLLDVEWISA